MAEAEDLFETADGDASRCQPLAARMRPRSVDEVLGQDHVLGVGKLLRRVIEADRLSSIILYGPPGCGKTSLAEVIARATQREFMRTSGVLANVAELRRLLEQARWHREGGSAILFVDEIHRFNKSQQDVLLPHVEDGTVTLIGATTHNPQIFVNSPLTSRSLVFELRPLSEDATVTMLERALADEERGLAAYRPKADPKALAFLAQICEGDARRALNALEIAVLSTAPGDEGHRHLTCGTMEDSIQRKMIVYDRAGDGHYDTISAFIKSVRGSDPHAATYWLAKMLQAGEDPRFIARRLVILASEDIGNADPRGLTMAVSAMHAAEFVGMPETRIILSQAATYLATAPKSNAAYRAIDGALKDVREGRTVAVPRKLKNVKPELAEPTTQGDAPYVYPHDFDGHFVPEAYLPDCPRYYVPTDQGYEATIGQRLQRWDEQRDAAHDKG